MSEADPMNDGTHVQASALRTRPRRPSLATTPLCHAHNRQGEPCRRHALRGALVCRSHGGAAPQVRRAAQERLADLLDPNRLLREAARIAYADVRDMLSLDGTMRPMTDWSDEFAGAVQAVEVVQRRGPEGGATEAVLKVKLSEKVRTIELLARHLGLLRDKLELTGRDGGPLKTVGVSDEELLANMRGLLAAAEARRDER